MNHVSPVLCPHSVYHHHIDKIPESILNAGNSILAERVKTKVNSNQIIFASYGPWLERQPEYIEGEFPHAEHGYRLVYDIGKHHYCVHISQNGHPHPNPVHMQAIEKVNKCVLL